MWFQAFMDIIFPPKRDALLVRNATQTDVLCRAAHQTYQGITTLMPFHDPLVRALIHEAKYHGNSAAAAHVGAVLSQYLGSLPHHTYLLIPIPLSATRLRERGYNQVTRIAGRALTTHPHITLREDIVIRTRNTKPQTELPRAGRLTNLNGAFSVTAPDAVLGSHILLIDDVVTTGTTLKTAEAMLLPFSPASITSIAIAH